MVIVGGHAPVAERQAEPGPHIFEIVIVTPPLYPRGQFSMLAVGENIFRIRS